jgi:hypothetical protein
LIIVDESTNGKLPGLGRAAQSRRPTDTDGPAGSLRALRRNDAAGRPGSASIVAKTQMFSALDAGTGIKTTRNTILGDFTIRHSEPSFNGSIS